MTDTTTRATDGAKTVDQLTPEEIRKCYCLSGLPIMNIVTSAVVARGSSSSSASGWSDMDQDHVDFLRAKAAHAVMQRKGLRHLTQQHADFCDEAFGDDEPEPRPSMLGIALALLLGLLLAPAATFLAVSAALDLF